MPLRHYSIEAIIIKRFNLGEADKVLTVITKKQGKLSCLARGIRRLSSRRASALELFSQVKLYLVKGKRWEVVTEVKLLSSFPNLRADLDKLRFAYQLVELVYVLVPENQAQEEVYQLLKLALSWLDKTSQPDIEGLRRFQIRLLQALGFGLPSKQDLPNLTQYIEAIIDRRLVTSHCLKV